MRPLAVAPSRPATEMGRRDFVKRLPVVGSGIALCGSALTSGCGGVAYVVPPAAPGQTSTPSYVGIASGLTIGRPSGVNPVAHVTSANGLAKRNSPLMRSIA